MKLIYFLVMILLPVGVKDSYSRHNQFPYTEAHVIRHFTCDVTHFAIHGYSELISGSQ